MKKFLSMTLALIMMMALAISAFAADTMTSVEPDNGVIVVKTQRDDAGEAVTGVILHSGK